MRIKLSLMHSLAIFALSSVLTAPAGASVDPSATTPRQGAVPSLAPPPGLHEQPRGGCYLPDGHGGYYWDADCNPVGGGLPDYGQYPNYFPDPDGGVIGIG